MQKYVYIHLIILLYAEPHFVLAPERQNVKEGAPQNEAIKMGQSPVNSTLKFDQNGNPRAKWNITYFICIFFCHIQQKRHACMRMYEHSKYLIFVYNIHPWNRPPGRVWQHDS